MRDCRWVNGTFRQKSRYSSKGRKRRSDGGIAMRNVKRRTQSLFGAAVILGTVAGCGGAPAPVAEMSAAQTAVTGAEEADAAKYAPSDLDRARDKLIRAQAAMQEEENEEARRLAEEALVDARAAEAKARAEAAQQLHSEASGDAPQPVPMQ
jgi:predicted lipid-binding transport protein (Tim44 family)